MQKMIQEEWDKLKKENFCKYIKNIPKTLLTINNS